jgi:hypothetical protein
MEKIISLFEIFGNNIITRNSIASFFEEINFLEKDKIVLDFNNVAFISRSCADEYLKQRKKSKKKVVEANMSKNVCDMFSLVNRQYEKEGSSILIQVLPECNSNSLVFA